jgi:hypothetical protein
MKPRPAQTPLEKFHIERVAALGCCVCGKPATVHHVTGYADLPGRLMRADKRVVPLCPPHHQAGHDPKAASPISVERLGHQGFYLRHGIDLYALAGKLWEESLCEHF